MARRIPLPRLTRRQRLAKWQRERRQQALYVGIFSTILFVALGLVGWAAAGRYYEENLKPAAVLDGRHIPMREYQRRLAFDTVSFYTQVGVPEESEEDPQVRSYVFALRKPALNAVVTGELLRTVARGENAMPTRTEVEQRAVRDYGELHVRHILIKPDAEAADKEKADADAKAKAQQIAEQIRADSNNAELWKDLAAKESADEGSKEQGGDLGWVGHQSNFVKEFEDAMFALGDGQLSEPVKTDHGYHVIQRIESRGITATAFFDRARRAGVTFEDLLSFSLTDLLRDRYEQRAKDAEIASPQEQVHLAQIVVRIPPPSQSEQYAAAITKLNAVTTALKEGKDFGEVAKEHSDDSETAEKGGDVGWVTRDMLRAEEVDSVDKNIAQDVFKRDVGERTDQHSFASGDAVIYKILEKDPARAVTDEQKTKIREDAFSLWLADREANLGVQRLIPGLEF